MNSAEFFEKSIEIDSEIKKLKEKKAELIKKAETEMVFEVEVSELQKELGELFSEKVGYEAKMVFDVVHLTLPAQISNKTAAKEYIEKHNPKLTISFRHDSKNYYNKEIEVDFYAINKTSDNTDVFDKLTLRNNRYSADIIFPKELRQKLLINIPLALLKEKDMFTKAILNCVKNKEKSQKNLKNTGNLEKNKKI